MRQTSTNLSIVAIAVGFAVFASTYTPAAALPLSQVTVTKAAETQQHVPATNGGTSTSNQILNKGGEPLKAQLPPSPTTQGSVSPIIEKNGPGKAIGPVANTQNQPALHICPLNDHSCPPLPTPNGNGNGGDKGKGGVVINLPPVVINRPAPVYVTPQPVVRTTVVESQPAATQPRTCLVKQYLSDGSALFEDVCTGESAIATQAQLQAEAQARRNQAPATN